MEQGLNTVEEVEQKIEDLLILNEELGQKYLDNLMELSRLECVKADLIREAKSD
jgi:hypothetical protein